MKRNLTVGISYEATYPATTESVYSDIQLHENRVNQSMFYKNISEIYNR